MRVGIFLGSKPSDGGTYLYSKAVLRGLMAFADNSLNKKDVIAVYSEQSWRDVVNNYSSLQGFYYDTSFIKTIALWWRRFGISTVLWRKIAPLIDPFTRFVQKMNCDFWFFPAQDIWAYRLPVNSITTIYDLMHKYESRFPEVSSVGRYKRREKHYKSICRWSTAVVVDSKIGRKQLKESYGISHENIYILPYIAFIDKLPVPSKAENILRKYSLPKKFIFYPAQFWAHKNHEILIEAVNKLKDELPDLCLVFTGSEKNNYQNIIRNIDEYNLNKMVVNLGFVSQSDIYNLYSVARALIFPSFFGPTNIPPLEAFYFGCPAAVADVYGMAEQIQSAAILFDPTSLTKVIDTVRILWNDDEVCSQLITKGHEWTRKWGAPQFNKQIENILLSINEKNLC